MNQNNIRNFCIIAHIDHGKSTLADRLLEYTHTVDPRQMKDQLLDQMDLERERGITIKLQPVRMEWNGYILNLIDTPGHVDFTYEVSRSLQAVEGALLVVDASQGIEAQTLANLYLALEQGLTIIPVINKIDLPAADPAKVSEEVIKLLGCKKEDIILASAKTGVGIDKIVTAVVERVPAPAVDIAKPLQALVFDSVYDDYQGVITYVRVVQGTVRKGEKLRLIATKAESESLEVGYFKPQRVVTKELTAGEIGYIVTGLKEVEMARVGDTVTHAAMQAPAVPGYREVKPMVFAGLFCKEGDDFPKLREALGKLKLSDASLSFEPDNSQALGFGFRCGFLGLLHLEIVQERLRREYNLDLIVTTPSVAYQIRLLGNKEIIIHSPSQFPDPSKIEEIREPMMKIEIVSPSQYIGDIMQLAQNSRGEYQGTEYLDATRVVLRYQIPLTSILVDFYDKLKSASSGYASLNYDFVGYQECEAVKLDILVAEEPMEALSTITYKDGAYDVGRKIVSTLKTMLPRQMFEVKLQAVIGGKIIASEKIPAMRKDVLKKMSGGDWTRKQKLLQKQKEGKKRMMGMGKVDIPAEAFLAVLKR
ncbi:MAG: translation elongation factor 4 [bacterium]